MSKQPKTSIIMPLYCVRDMCVVCDVPVLCSKKCCMICVVSVLWYRVPTLFGNLGNSWAFDLCHFQPRIGGEFIKFMQSGWKSTENISVRKMTSKLIQFLGGKMEKLGNLLQKSCGKHVALVEDLKS